MHGTDIFPWLGVAVIGLSIWALLRPDRAYIILAVATLVLGVVLAASGFIH